MSFNRNNVIIVGDSDVGKTSLLRKFMENKFDENEMTTHGVAFRPLDYNYDGLELKIAVWDSSSLPQYRQILRFYYKDVSAAIVVYDVTNRLSFESTNSWINTMRKHSRLIKQISLVANKIDCRDRFNSKHVSRKEGMELAARKSVQLFETSAKLGHNVSEMFSNTLDGMVKRYVLTPIELKIFKYKTIVSGDSGVGKSALIDRFCGHPIANTNNRVSFRTVTREVSHCPVVLDLWEAPGQSDESLIPLYYRSAQTIILVYDIQSEQSFNNLHKYLDILYSTCDEMPFIVLLGNKTDESSRREVRHRDVNELVDEHDVIGLCDEVSAKCDNNFDKLLNKICSNLMNIFANIPLNLNMKIKNKNVLTKGKFKNWLKCGSKTSK